jgi:hypothetical protein
MFRAAVEAYLMEMVEPTIAEFEKEPWSRRNAFLACVTTYHTIDYFPRPPFRGTWRKYVQSRSPTFTLVDRVAHAFKHMQTGHVDNPRLQPLAANQVYERPPAFAGTMMVGVSMIGDTRGGVAIVGENGSDILSAVQEALAFLRGEAAKLP